MHRPCAFADRLKVVLDALPENGDRLFDDGAALLLLLHRHAFALRIAPLGDILVRSNPAAIGHGAIDDRYRPSIRRFYFGAGRLARRHGAHQVAPVFGGSPVKLPLLILYLSRFCSVMPGLT